MIIDNLQTLNQLQWFHDRRRFFSIGNEDASLPPRLPRQLGTHRGLLCLVLICSRMPRFFAAQSQHRWPWNCVWLHWERGWHTRLKSDGLIFGSTVKYHHGQWHIGKNKVVHFRLSWHLHWLLCSSGLEMIHPVSIYISFFSKHEALCFERSQRNNTLWFLSSVGQSLTLMMLHATRSSVHTHPFLLLLEEQRSFLSSYYIGPFLASCTELL